MMKNKLHLHSMVVHAPCATIPLAAITHALFLFKGNPVYKTAVVFLVTVSLITSLISIATGILERNKKHANWFPSFKRKLIFSVLLVISLATTLPTILQPTPFPGIINLSIWVVQPILVVWIMVIGLISTQGRYGGKLSYAKNEENQPDYDILSQTLQTLKEVDDND